MANALEANIKNFVHEQGITITELERRAGVKKATINNILRGRSKNPTLATLKAISEQIGCSVDELSNKKIDASFLRKDTAEIVSEETKAKIKYNLILEATQEIISFLKEKDITVSTNSIYKCVDEIQEYATEHNLSSIDTRFARWIAKRNLVLHEEA